MTSEIQMNATQKGNKVNDTNDIVEATRRAADEVIAAARGWLRPSVMFRPRIYLDGNEWIAFLGDNLREGVVGTGRSPDEAMKDFDVAWTTKQPAMTPINAG